MCHLKSVVVGWSSTLAGRCQINLLMRITLKPLFVLYFKGLLSTSADQNASCRNSVDLLPIGATKRVTHQWQPSWMFIKMPQRCPYWAFLCTAIVLDLPHSRYTVVIVPAQAVLLAICPIGVRPDTFARAIYPELADLASG